MPQETDILEGAAASAVDDERLAAMRALWAEVTGRPVISDDTNFFQAGGDSLLLVALVERIRQETGVAVRTIDVLRAATVRGQAELVAGLRAAP